jgi:hypothetical protein
MNDEARMPNQWGMISGALVIRHSNFFRHSSLGFHHSHPCELK